MGSTYHSRSTRRSMDGSRRGGTPPGLGGTDIATMIIYAVTATLVLCSLSTAKQMFFDEQQVVQSTSPTTAGGMGRGATRSHEGREGDESVDPEAPGARDPLRRGPSTPPEHSPPPGARDGSHPTEARGAQVRPAAGKGSGS